MIKHLAIIMDGNRRWAKKNALSYSVGYREGGASAIRIALDFTVEHAISYLSLYTFSLENFKRPEEEKNFLFESMIIEGKNNLAYIKERNVKVCFIGDRTLFPEKVKEIVNLLEQETQHNTALQLNILFCYGGRQELVSSMQAIARMVQQGKLSPDAITEQTIADHLWTQGIPDPELVIRTSGVQRLSNFLLFQAAYSELFFLDCLWPEITKQDLQKALDACIGTKRNFGV